MSENHHRNPLRTHIVSSQAQTNNLSSAVPLVHHPRPSSVNSFHSNPEFEAVSNNSFVSPGVMNEAMSLFEPYAQIQTPTPSSRSLDTSRYSI